MKILHLFALLFINATAFGQVAVCQPCKKCDTKKITTTFLTRYSSEKLKQEIIHRNWSEFLGENLENKLPSVAKNANVISIKFDGLGCVYPDFINETFQQPFLQANKQLDDESFEKNTFYSISHHNSNDGASAFHRSIPERFRDPLKSIVTDKVVVIKGTDKIASSFFEYSEIWNKVFMPEITSKIKSTISSQGINRIVVFCPGYNVPYSLAQLQANVIMDQYDSLLNPEEFKKILFIKIFWPSLDKKSDKYSDQGLTFKNDLSLKTIWYYSFITNRAFHVGLNLRRVFNSFSFDEPIDIIAHSSGTTAIASLLINPIEKINLRKNNTAINRMFVQKFKSEQPEYKIPNKHFKIFLNASSMPGVGTFNRIDMNDPIQQKYTWVIGHNKRDRVLNKFLYIFRLPEGLGNTRLGGDTKEEVKKTEAEIKSNNLGLNKNFTFPRLGIQKNLFGHDFFCYLQQPLFQNEFSKFIKRE